MKIVLKRTKASPDQGCGDLYALMLLVGVMLLLRDAFGIGINKYLFVLIVGGAACAFPIGKVMCLIAFVMPLYVGMPGNYLTLIFLVRFCLRYRAVKLNGYNVVFCILAGGYALIQSVATNHLAIAELVFFPSMVLVMLMFSNGVRYSSQKMVLCYAMGVAALGLIMLVSTLQKYGFSDLLASSSRLGTAAAEYSDAGVMNVSMDPNFYGMFAISAVSMGVPLLGSTSIRMRKTEKLTLAVCVVICIAVALIGLSRAFLLVLVLWMLMYAVSRKRIGTCLKFLLVSGAAVILVMVWMPEVVAAVQERFNGLDMMSGNGRGALLRDFFGRWMQSARSMLWGVGLFDCNVHCTPLQALFGGGTVFACLLGGFIGSLPKMGRRTAFYRAGRLPLLVTFVMSLSVPAMNLLNFMYPLIVIGLWMKNGSDEAPVLNL